MKINKVTITGADDSIDINTLVQFQKKFPFVEWGILLNLYNAGSNKFPSSKWLGNCLAAITRDKLNTSAHLCGIYAKDVMKGPDKYNTIQNLKGLFNRFQINFNFKTSGEYDMEYITQLLSTIDTTFIFQYNKSNEGVLKEFLTKNKKISNVNILFDSSGGRGTMIKQIPTPFNIYTGYSGGLTPNNVEQFCTDLIKFPNDSTVWVDVESGVRTDNKFDIDKVEDFLTITSKFITYD